jgi:hypothetical protein
MRPPDADENPVSEPPPIPFPARGRVRMGPASMLEFDRVAEEETP